MEDQGESYRIQRRVRVMMEKRMIADEAGEVGRDCITYRRILPKEQGMALHDS